jgi:hypothetical protein
LGGRVERFRNAIVTCRLSLDRWPGANGGEGSLGERPSWIALATEPGELRSAARLVGAVDAVRQNARITGWPGELELRRRFERPLIDALGEDDWAREQAVGATLTLEEAIELARTLAATQPEATTHSA